MQNYIKFYEQGFSNAWQNGNMSVNIYGIEEHLRSFRDTDHFNILYNSWIIEKEEYRNRLNTVEMTYQTYSLHDATHAEAILRQIAYFLGDSRIKELSPTDAWLILECAYCHDLGMVVTAEALYNELAAIDQNDFEDFSRRMYESENDDVRLSWNYLEPLFTFANQERHGEHDWKDESTERRVNIENLNRIFRLEGYKWPAHFTKAFMVLIEERCRPKHARMSRDMIKNEADEKSYEGLIPLRFRHLIAEIAALHTDDRENVLKNLRQNIQGFGGDYAHPRFIAELIRIGDLLDMDNNRFNKYQLAVAGDASYNSFAHQLKHRALRNFLVTPDVIMVEANFTKEDAKKIYYGDKIDSINEDGDNDKISVLVLKAFKELSGWLQMLRKELDFFCRNWLKIVPENLSGNCPYFEDEILLLDGKSVDNGLIDLRYHITAKRASEIIEGAGLYEDIFSAFIREIIQNSMDATKRKIYLDIKRKSRNKFDDPLEFYKYISRDIEELAIEVNCTSTRDDVISLKIRDYGSGITYDCLQGMQHIGDIPHYKISKQAEKMPAWWKPTGSFGIGMQTIFSFSKEFKLKTKTEEEKLLRKMKFHSTQIGGKIDSYIIDDSKESRNFRCGTEIQIDIPLQMMLLLQEKEYFGQGLDYFGDATVLLENEIHEAIRHIRGSFGIPVKLLSFKKSSIDNNSYGEIDDEEYLSRCFGNYFINLTAKKTNQGDTIRRVLDRIADWPDEKRHECSGFSCWSEENHVLIRYRWQHWPQYEDQKECCPEIYFNEIRVDDRKLVNMIRFSFFEVEVYLFDENAENFLQVDRDSFLNEKRSYIADMICNTHLNCLKYLLDIQEGDEEAEAEESQYKLAVWKEKDGCANGLARTYFDFLICSKEISTMTGEIDWFIQRNDSICYIKQSVFDSSVSLKHNDIWLMDARYKYISEVRLKQNYDGVERCIIEDLFPCCMDLAITKLVCMEEIVGDYTVIYKVHPRSGQPVLIDDVSFLSYIAMRYGTLKDKKQKLARIILPGSENYKQLCVGRLRGNIGTDFERKWDSAIIMPVTIEQLDHLLEQQEEKQAEKMIEEEFLTEINPSYISIIEYIKSCGIMRGLKRGKITKAYKELLLETWMYLGKG